MLSVDVDYDPNIMTPPGGLLQFDVGEGPGSRRSAFILIIDDSEKEDNETVVVRASGAMVRFSAGRNTATVEIIDNGTHYMITGVCSLASISISIILSQMCVSVLCCPLGREYHLTQLLRIPQMVP